MMANINDEEVKKKIKGYKCWRIFMKSAVIRIKKKVNGASEYNLSFYQEER